MTLKRGRLVQIVLLVVSVPCLAGAQPSPVDGSGYLKYLSSVSRIPGIEETLFDQQFHGRASVDWYPSMEWTGSAEVQLRAFYGGSVVQIQDFLDQVKTRYQFTDLDAVVWKGGRSVGYAQIDRLWLDYTKNSVEATIGRQRVAWGTALVWNVIDLFNPKSVLDFDYEEKPGTDAVRVQYYTGPISKGDVVVRPGPTVRKTIIAGAYSFNAVGFDFFALAGVRENRWVAGGAWAGSVLAGGFRGEFLVSQMPGHPAVSAVLSGDYTFESSLYVHSEVLFNNNGTRRDAGLFQAQALDEGLLSPARWSYYQEFAYDLTPLTRATLFGILNPDDHSVIVAPMVSYSMKTNVELLVIGLIASGHASSEFGAYGKAVYVRLKYSF
jgi:hypothetical protein